MKIRILFLTAIVVSAFVVPHLIGQGHTDPFPITTATGDQDYFQAAYSPSTDTYLVVWQDYRNGEYDIYGQILDWDGSTIGENFAVCDVSGDQKKPRLDIDTELDRYLVVFEDYRDQHAGGIYGVFVGSDGTVQSMGKPMADQSFPISTNSMGPVYWPSVAFNTSSRIYLVVWGDSRNDPTNIYGADVYGQMLNATGTLIAPPNPPDVNVNFPIADTDIEESVTDVSYSELTNEWFVVYGTSIGIVMGQRVNDAGQLVNQDGTVAVTKSNANNQEPSAIEVSLEFWNGTICLRTVVQYMIAMLGVGKPMQADTECLVAWKGSYDTAPDNDVYCQRIGFFMEGGVYVAKYVDVNGNVTEQPSHIPVCLATDWQQAVDLAYNSHDNEYLLAWGDLRSGNGNIDLYCQRLWINNDDEMVMLADDRVNTVTNLENILLAGTSNWEGTHQGVAYNSYRNEYLVAYKVGEPVVPRATSGSTGDGSGQRVHGPAPSLVGDANAADIPGSFAIGQNYPNPFNSETVIPFHVKSPSRVTIKIYDLLGHERMTLIDNHYLPGRHTIRMNSSGLSSGVYFYTVQMGDFKQAKKMVVME